MDNSGVQPDQDLTTPPIASADGISFQPPKTTEPTLMPNSSSLPPIPVVATTESWTAPVMSPAPAPETPTTVVNVGTVTPSSPWVTTPAPTPQLPETPSPQPTSIVTETKTETQPIIETKKQGASPILLGLVALLLVGGVAGTTFMLSRGVSNQEPIAPNAPASEPKAFEPEPTPTEVLTPVPTEPFDPLGTIDCSAYPSTAQYGNRCFPTTTDENGNVIWVNDPNDIPNPQ